MASQERIRIYDLARDRTPSDIDEKLQKKIQAEITREIIKISQDFGQKVKTASSSIDLSSIEDIFSRIDINSIVGTLTGKEPDKDSETEVKNRSRSKVKEKPSEPELIQKRLKIVRRISPTLETEEPSISETGISAGEERSGSVQSTEISESSSVKSQPDAPSVSGKNELDQDHLKQMFDSVKQPGTNKTKTIGIKQINNVQSIPLKPGVSSQPYRVGRPTTIVQGIGRKKKKSFSQEDDKPKRVRIRTEAKVDEGPKSITIIRPMTVRELSHKIDVPETNIITYFFMRKVVKTVNDMLEKDLIVEYLKSLNYVVNTKEDETAVHQELKSTLAEDETEGNLISRPPVVTIMGHVDHGKTTLLDAIREAKAKVVDQEYGGITQHVSAYRIVTKDYDKKLRKLTFIDTPGHEAFAAMRKRGAHVTDIVVLIVAADDGVMPQTVECIKHIKEAKVPFLVAINKIDKPGANPDKVLGQLAEHGIIVEQYGGTVVYSMISALSKKNLDDLLEKILLVADAELADRIRSNPNRPAVGTVIEAELSRVKGPLATVLVQNGTLKVGDYIAAGAVSGRVKALFDEYGVLVEEAEPSTPVKILGFSGVPKAGDTFKAYSTIQEAKKAAEEIKTGDIEAKRFAGLSSFTSEIREGQVKEFRIIIKADVQGSAEAIAHELNKLSTEEILVQPIAVESGSITSNEIFLAERTGAMVAGFHVGTDSQTAKLADKLGVQIKSYEVIYDLTNDVQRAVLGLHEPEKEESKLGELEVRKIFVINKRNIAGCLVTSGKVQRKEIARVIREGVKVYEGKVDYLRRFKDEAKEVKEGLECGLSFEKFDDLQEGDIIECWTVKEIARTKL